MAFSDEVKLWEQVKVRVLNAGHLTLTYPALLLGYREVAEAMRDQQVPVLLDRFLDAVVLPLLDAPRDVDLVTYKNTVLERFSNEAMHDQLTRIASDSASKVTVFLTTTLQQVLERGTDHRIPAFVLASWSCVLQGKDDDGKHFEVTEPRLDETARRLLISGDPYRSAAYRAAAGKRCRRARRLRRHLRSLPQSACGARCASHAQDSPGRHRRLTPGRLYSSIHRRRRRGIRRAGAGQRQRRRRPGVAARPAFR